MATTGPFQPARELVVVDQLDHHRQRCDRWLVHVLRSTVDRGFGPHSGRRSRPPEQPTPPRNWSEVGRSERQQGGSDALDLEPAGEMPDDLERGVDGTDAALAGDHVAGHDHAARVSVGAVSPEEVAGQPVGRG